MIIQPGDAKRIILQVSPSDLDGQAHRQKPEETIAFKSLSQVASSQVAGEDYACWLIYTEQSAKTATFLKRHFSSSFRFDSIGGIKSMDNALKIFELVMRIASDPINAGRSVICDCTGGTKTMSIALALACNHHKLTSESRTELILTFIPSGNNGDPIAFHKYDLSRVIAEEQQRYIDQQKRIGRLRHLARLSPILAHEIRNPLNLISADLYLLRNQPANSYSQDLLREIEASVKEIDKIIGGIQQAVREDSDTHLQPVIHLTEATRRIKARTEKRFPEVALEINGSLSGVRLRIPEEKLYTIFTNLIDNAANANRGKGKVRMNFEPGEDRLRVAIEDEGPGIPSDLKTDLFKPMRKGKDSPGTGMGLSIVKSFVTEEGGAITYDDSYKSGARFVIELPILPMNGRGHDKNLNGG
jgi:signal transduction histidine kinase